MSTTADISAVLILRRITLLSSDPQAHCIAQPS
jgi:hypothetical protein